MKHDRRNVGPRFLVRAAASYRKLWRYRLALSLLTTAGLATCMLAANPPLQASCASNPDEKSEGLARDSDIARKELKQLEGTWKPKLVESGGVKAAAKDMEGFDEPTVIKNGKTKWTTTEGKEYDVAITVDPTKAPKTIDRKVIDGEGALKDFVSRSIYELDGDMLRVCYNAEREEVRPRKFTSEGTFVVVTFERCKKTRE
jgi:uncharacterized protein (TIGR03067 family)